MLTDKSDQQGHFVIKYPLAKFNAIEYDTQNKTHSTLQYQTQNLGSSHMQIYKSLSTSIFAYFV